MGENEMQQSLIVVGFLFPPHEDAAVAVEPRSDALDHPAPGALAPHALFGLFLAPRADVRHVAAAAESLAERLAIVALVEAQMLPTARSLGRGNGRLSSVSKRSFWSWVLAPLIARPIGMPRRSERIDRLTPSLPRSVGFLPVFFPAQRRLGHRAIDALPIPADAAPPVVALQHLPPRLAKHALLGPLLKVAMHRAAAAVLARQRLPLAARAEHIEDAVHYRRRLARGRPPRGDFAYLGNNGSICRQNASAIRQLDPRNSFLTSVTSVPL